jgi:hypothetical protein
MKPSRILGQPMSPVRPPSLGPRWDPGDQGVSRSGSRQLRGPRRLSLIWLIPISCFAVLGLLSWRVLAVRSARAATKAAANDAERTPPAPPTSIRRPAHLLPPTTFEPVEAVAPEPAAPQPAWKPFQEKFAAEGVDPQWSAKKEAEIRQVVADLALPGTTLVSAHCARTVCQVIFDHTDADAQRNAPFALSKAPFATAVHYRYEGLRTTAYVQHE